MKVLEFIINLIFFGIFLTIGILSYALTNKIKKDLTKTNQSNSNVVIQGVNWKEILEHNKNLSLSAEITSFISSLIFLFYSIKIWF